MADRPMTTMSTTDVVELLLADHEEAKALLGRFDHIAPTERASYFCEVVTELVAQPLEALRRSRPVAREAEAEHTEILVVAALAGASEVGVAETDIALAVGTDCEWQRRLREHRCQYDVVHHHGQGETSRQAHADDADTRSSALVVSCFCQHP